MQSRRRKISSYDCACSKERQWIEGTILFLLSMMKTNQPNETPLPIMSLQTLTRMNKKIQKVSLGPRLRGERDRLADQSCYLLVTP